MNDTEPLAVPPAPVAPTELLLLTLTPTFPLVPDVDVDVLVDTPTETPPFTAPEPLADPPEATLPLFWTETVPLLETEIEPALENGRLFTLTTAPVLGLISST